MGPTTTNIPKHRASKACERCRVRKVRCDIVRRADRCTNCSLDDVECVEPGPRRRRRTGRRLKDARETNIEKDKPGLIASSNSSPADEIQEKSIEPVVTDDNMQIPILATKEQSLDLINHGDGEPVPDSNEDLFPDFTSDLLTKGPAAPSLSHKSPNEHRTHEGNTFESLQRLLPTFAAPVRSERMYIHADFLHAQGAFKLPHPKPLRALLARYVEFVHPQLPLIDIHSILQAIATDGADGKVSFFLLQAMLLAAAAFVDAEHLIEAGYRHRMEFRREQAERVRLLYDFDCETDRLILVQSLILMTSWQDKGDEVKHLRHWLSIAYNIALLLGLNKELPSCFNFSKRYRSLRKRTWWSLYMRDRTLSLGLRQWPIIPAEVCEVSELDADDFDVGPVSKEVSTMVEDCPLLQDLEQQVRLTEVFREQLQISHKIYEVFKARYTSVGPKLGSTHMIALVLVPKPLNFVMAEVQACSAELDRWFKALPEKLRYRTPLSLYFDPEEDVLVLHCGILNLFYYALVCALHRPYPSPEQRELPASERNLHRNARHAANAMFSVLEEFQALDIICFMPTQGLTFMLQGAITALCDTTSKVTQVRNQSIRRIQTCLEILTNLADVHSYAPFAINFLTAAATKLGATTPLCHNALGSSQILGQTPAVTFLPNDDSVQALDQPPTNTEVGTDNWTVISDSVALPSRELSIPSMMELPEMPSSPQWIDTVFEYNAANFLPGWEFFLDPL